jgi:carboxypeptidase C (cathepsin A)
MGNYDSKDTFDYSGALGKALEAGVKVTLYYGKADTACNYVGGLAMADTIAWKHTQDFKSMAMSTIEVGGAELGQQKSFGGLTFIQVRTEKVLVCCFYEC